MMTLVRAASAQTALPAFLLMERAPVMASASALCQDTEVQAAPMQSDAEPPPPPTRCRVTGSSTARRAMQYVNLDTTQRVVLRTTCANRMGSGEVEAWFVRQWFIVVDRQLVTRSHALEHTAELARRAQPNVRVATTLATDQIQHTTVTKTADGPVEI
jgi:hypothetical protein